MPTLTRDTFFLIVEVFNQETKSKMYCIFTGWFNTVCLSVCSLEQEVWSSHHSQCNLKIFQQAASKLAGWFKSLKKKIKIQLF